MTLSLRRAARPGDYPDLVEIWESAVTATHGFLAQEDFEEIRSHLASDYLPAVNIVIAEGEDGPVGFAGTLDGNLEMLFVHNDHRGRGVGSALLRHVVAEHGVTKVDVNEQNLGATGFYEHSGFRIASRSKVDEAGRPYPLLHLELDAT